MLLASPDFRSLLQLLGRALPRLSSEYYPVLRSLAKMVRQMDSARRRASRVVCTETCIHQVDVHCCPALNSMLRVDPCKNMVDVHLRPSSHYGLSYMISIIYAAAQAHDSGGMVCQAPDGEPVLLDCMLPVLRKLEFLEAPEQLALAVVNPSSKDWEVAIALMRIGQHSAGEFISAMLEMAEKVLPPAPADPVGPVSEVLP